MRPATRTQSGQARPSRGPAFSLVEALVGAGILAAVLLPALTVMQEGARTAEVSIEETLAAAFAHEFLEEARSAVIAAGTARITEIPHPNAAPEYPLWQDWPSGGVAMPIPPPSAALEVPTRGFTRTGQPLTLDRTPPEFAPYQRLYQSPLPPHTTRRFKLHPAIRSLAPLTEDAALWVLEVAVAWETPRPGPTQRREVVLRAAIPGGPL